MNKTHKVVLVTIVVMFGLYFVRVFPNPYHDGTGNVNIFEWVYREIDELINGERVPID